MEEKQEKHGGCDGGAITEKMWNLLHEQDGAGRECGRKKKLGQL